MILDLQAEAPPLRKDSTGAIRVGESQVLLEIVVSAFQAGATPETIVQRFPTASLKDVYATIAYYLRHPNEVEEYLAERDQKAEEIKRLWDLKNGDMSDIRARLMARRRLAEQGQ